MKKEIRKIRNRLAGVRDEALEETQLTLNLKKEELFDSHIVLPHPEVNQVVYDAVDRFVERYSGESMAITIMSGDVNPSLQGVFREAYYSHYDDEYQKANRYLHRRYVRVVGLLLISAVTFFAGGYISGHLDGWSFIASLASQVSIFCLWEVGYTHFDRSAASEREKLILRARDAEITFV